MGTDNVQIIKSVQNEQIKQLVKLRDRKGRRAAKLFLCEGLREIRRALNCGYKLEKVAILSGSEIDLDILSAAETVPVLSCDDSVWKKLAVRETTEKIIAVFHERRFSGSDIEVERSGIWLIADGIEKPGNLGAMIRTCDGVGAAGLILTNSLVDPFNPNVIRSSQGAVFNIPVVSMSVEDAKKWAANYDVVIYVADPKGTDVTLGVEYLGDRLAFVVGNEATGVSDEWMTEEHFLKLPMNGICDSLNVSVAAAVLMYDAHRQLS